MSHKKWIIFNWNLVILNQREPSHGFNYTSGVVNSILYNNSQGFEQAYGYFEARILPSKGGFEGMCPAFWLPNILNNGDDGTREIDIMEVPGGKCCGEGHAVYYTVHNQKDERFGSKNLTQGYWGDNYHIFAVLWQTDQLCWFIDNVKQFCTNDLVPSTPSYIVFDNEIGLGGDKWAGIPDSNTPFPQIMKVDYVRVWKQSS